VPGVDAGLTTSSVNALATDGTYLYVGGSYTFFRNFDSTITNIAYFDGGSWYPMGASLGPSVVSLAFFNGQLHAGGSFTNSGTSPVKRIAKWDGSSWSQVGAGFTNGTVGALGANGSALYAGGSFTNSGGTPLNFVAKWAGASWLPLGSGVSRTTGTTPSVSGMLVNGDDVYLAGSFNLAGGKPSSYLARWNETLSFVPPQIRLLNPRYSLGSFTFQINGISSGTYTIEASTNLSDWIPIYTDSASNTNFSDPAAGTIRNRAYRLRTP